MRIEVTVPQGWTEAMVLNSVRQRTGFVVKQTTTNFEDVTNFHERFDVPVPATPHLLNEDALAFRLKFLEEELGEFILDHTKEDLPNCVDAMVDLVYVAMGTASMMGITPQQWSQAWNEVQRANMSKVRAISASDSKRGSALDVIKPEGWKGPDYSFLGNGPWPVTPEVA